jgi:hypothetical protein
MSDIAPAKQPRLFCLKTTEFFIHRVLGAVKQALLPVLWLEAATLAWAG